MKTVERDRLLERLDERTDSIIRELKTQNAHLSKINGTLEKHSKSITQVETTLYEVNGICDKVKNNSINITRLSVIVAVVSAGIGGGVSQLVNAFI